MVTLTTHIWQDKSRKSRPYLIKKQILCLYKAFDGLGNIANLIVGKR